jgi:hypothetical protein
VKIDDLKAAFHTLEWWNAAGQKYALVISAPSLRVLPVNQCLDLDLLQSRDIKACQRGCSFGNGAKCVAGTCVCENPLYSGLRLYAGESAVGYQQPTPCQTLSQRLELLCILEQVLPGAISLRLGPVLLECQ